MNKPGREYKIQGTEIFPYIQQQQKVMFKPISTYLNKKFKKKGKLFSQS